MTTVSVNALIIYFIKRYEIFDLLFIYLDSRLHKILFFLNFWTNEIKGSFPK